MKTPKHNIPETHTSNIPAYKINGGKTLKDSSHLTHQASRILKHVAAKHRVTVEDIKGEARAQHIVNARADSFTRLRGELGYSYSKIAGLFGRNHSGILRAIRNWEKVKRAQELAEAKIVAQKPKPKPEPEPEPTHNKAQPHAPSVMDKKTTRRRQDARVQAIEAQIRKAEQYGREGEARALRGHRWRVMSGGLG